ncbi:MAG: 5-(carboxyamino)imidazole ribonucleotide synthase [Proteobacteria bacterium]|nr:5-(carboxyamino)imidazole ribonucleotide synthase [Pseudomonadota bacterium]
MKQDSKTLGILGGGQLGRMSALAAARLGILVHIYSPEADCPAGQVAARTFTSAYDDKKALKAFAESVDAVTCEFENIPVETIRFIQKTKPVYPDDRLLETAQDRIREKKFLNDIGIPTTRWTVVRSAADVDKFVSGTGNREYILKTARFGYDGKGQTSGRADHDDSKAKIKSLNSDSIIIEEPVDFSCEISVIVARDKLSQTAIYGPMLNEHNNHILAKTIVPAPIPNHMAEKAQDMARLLADAVDLVGVLTLEMFITRDGRILANEIAPRAHNSGHWTIDACAVSQFEQHVRTVCGMPVGLPARHSDAVMINIIGDDVKKLAPYYEMKHACVHLYGKREVRAGRKMGHVTILKPIDENEKRHIDADAELRLAHGSPEGRGRAQSS